MKIYQKIILFLIIFTVGFYFARVYGANYIQILISDLGGLTYLYSTVGIIFALFAAFVILFEAERWNNLIDSVKGEVGELNELLLWSMHLPEKLKTSFEKDIKEYLENLISVGWQIEKTGEKNTASEEILGSLHNDVYQILKEAPDLMPTAFSTFSEVIKHREKRIHYASFHLPRILKNTLVFSDILLVVLSLFIGVHNTFLDYFFLTSIAILGYIIYQLVDDMDNPIRQGGWHVTTKDYEMLLTKLNANSMTHE